MLDWLWKSSVEEQQSWGSSSAERNPTGASKQAKLAEEGHWDSKLTEEPSRQGKKEKRTSWQQYSFKTVAVTHHSFWDKGSAWNVSWPGTQGHLASESSLLQLKVCTTTPGLWCYFHLEAGMGFEVSSPGDWEVPGKSLKLKSEESEQFDIHIVLTWIGTYGGLNFETIPWANSWISKRQRHTKEGDKKLRGHQWLLLDQWKFFVFFLKQWNFSTTPNHCLTLC